MLLMHEIRDFHPLLCRSDIELFGGAAWEGARPAPRKDSAGECDSEANQRKSQGGGKPRPYTTRAREAALPHCRGDPLRSAGWVALPLSLDTIVETHTQQHLTPLPPT